MKSLAVAALAVTVALGGCSTLETARGRLVRTPSNCVNQTVQIYFEPESAALTPEGQSVISAAAANVHNCRVKAVEVLGLADAPGTPAANLELSQRRAQSVSHALAAAGLPAAEFRVSAAGDVGALTAAGDAKPLRRRVDVTLHVAR
jgi:outer membrane protein OmpA-like peptidoglycan-associated protein